MAPRIKNAYEVEKVPFGHLFVLVPMLAREAYRAEREIEWIPRVALWNDQLILSMRHPINEKFAGVPMIWLDGTAEPRIAAALTGREVQVVDPPVKIQGEVYQIHNRANGKNVMVDDKEPTKAAREAENLVRRLIEQHGYKYPGIITFKDIRDKLGSDIDRRGHFGGERGTNSFGDCDALFVVGTPQPKITDMLKLAKMIFFERDQSFNTKWSIQDVQYQGTDYAYPTSGFWHDDDLLAVLRQSREAEIEQSAHRARPMIRKADVWLFSNIPIMSLPPSSPAHLKSVAEIARVSKNGPYNLPDILAFAKQRDEEVGYVTTVDLHDKFGMPRPTAGHYIAQIAEHFRWPAKEGVRGLGPGRPPKGTGRRLP